MPLIDFHQHVIPDVYKSELARVGVMGSGENPWPAWSLSRMRELMDEMGIDAVVLSIASPGAYFGDIEFTRPLVRKCNDVMARMVKDRYSSWDSGLGAEIEAGKQDFASLEKHMLQKGEITPNTSGRQELFESAVNRYVF